MTFYKENEFKAAIIGIDHHDRIVYDKSKMMGILMSQGYNYDDALEHLEYNIWSAYVAEDTPIYVLVVGIDEINNL